MGQAQGIVFEEADAGMAQSAPHALGAVRLHAGEGTVPPIVVPEDGKGAERRFEDRERLRPLLRHNRAGDEVMPAGKIPEEHGEIGVKRVGDFRDFADARRRHPRLAGMDVGDNAIFRRRSAGQVAGSTV